jgi:hypothetical protein
MLFREVNMLCREAWDQTRRNQCTPLLSRLFTLQLPKNRPSLLSDHTRVLGGLVLLCSLDIMGSKFYNFSSDLFSECTTYASRSTECTEGAPGIVLRTLTKKKKKKVQMTCGRAACSPLGNKSFLPQLAFARISSYSNRQDTHSKLQRYSELKYCLSINPFYLHMYRQTQTHILVNHLQASCRHISPPNCNACVS